MTRFFTADLHLGHANIIDYCQRPYAGPWEMNAALIDNWNETVSPDDEVWVLGDVAMGKLRETLPLVSLLNGHKQLVAGNHDRCWDGHKRGLAAALQAYSDAGFETIHQGWVTVDDWLCCHFPYVEDVRHGGRFAAHQPPYQARWLLHGHVHDLWKVKDWQINVGVDVWDYRPVSEDQIRELIVPSV
jgi:calcineurin-like phosphoesterase family protein